MKKQAIISLSIIWAVLAQGQILNVSSIDQMRIPDSDNMILQAAAISPQGDYLLLSTDTKQGLYKWDLATSGMTTITEDAGAGTQVIASRQRVNAAVSITFDLVPEESETRTSHPDYTGRLCVIGCDLAEDKLAELFGLRE